MATLDELLAAQLLQKKEALAARNPFSIAGSAIGGTDFSGAFDPKDAWKASLLQNLVGGFATSVGQRQTDSEFGSLASRLSQAYDSPDVMAAMRQQPGLAEFSGLAKMIQAQRAGETAQKLQELQGAATLQAPLLAQRFPEAYGDPFGTAKKSQVWIDPDIPQDADTQAALANAMESEGVMNPMQEQSGGGGGSWEDQMINLQGMGLTANAAADLLEQRSGSGGAKYPSMQPLKPEEKVFWAEKLKIDPNLLSVRGDLQNQLSLRRSVGENTRPISGEELKQVNANDFFRKIRLGRLQELAKGLDDNSLVRATQGGKLVSWFGKTDSPDYKFYAELKAAQQEYARAKDSGALSTFDVQIWGPLFEGLPLLDSGDTIRNRLTDLSSTMADAKKMMLDNLKKGGVNLFDLEEKGGGSTDIKRLPGESLSDWKARTGL